MMPPKARKTSLAGRLVGYARVSTDEQGTDPQRDEEIPAEDLWVPSPPSHTANL
jgi:hypothetical protein